MRLDNCFKIAGCEKMGLGHEPIFRSAVVKAHSGWGNNSMFFGAIWMVISSHWDFPCSCLRKWLQKIVKKPLEHHSDKTMRLLRHKLLSSCLTFVSRFDDFIIWFTFLFPHQMKSECQCCSICSGADVNPLFWFWHNFNTDLPTCANWTPDGAITGLRRALCDQWEAFIVTD